MFNVFNRLWNQILRKRRFLEVPFSYCCYLSDRAVDRDYQHRGIGKQLLHTMRKQLGDEVMVCLLSAPEAMAYYPHAGFKMAEQAWWIPLKR